MKLREHLEQAKTWKLVTKSVDDKVVEFTLSAKEIKPATFRIYGMVCEFKA